MSEEIFDSQYLSPKNRNVDVAVEEAFKIVQRKLTTSADLESLEQIKQQTYLKQQDRLTRLKARVNTVVTNIASGIDDLNQTSRLLHTLQGEISDIENESSNASTKDKIGYFDDLTVLATVYERLYKVNQIISRMDEADKLIDKINCYFNTSPDSFSIKCFKTIQLLLSIEEELLTESSKEEVKLFIKKHFQSVHDNLDKLLTNIQKKLESIFDSNTVINKDEIIRANWIYCAIDKKSEITNCIKSSMVGQLQKIVTEATEENLDSKLKSLVEMIENLPEKLQEVMPSLPPDIEAFSLISELANQQIIIIFTNLLASKKNSSYVVMSLIKCMREIECTMRALLGISPTIEYLELIVELENKFSSFLIDDFNFILTNIIKIDQSDCESISVKGKVVYTQAPSDFMSNLRNAYVQAVHSGLPSIIPEMRVKLIDTLRSRLEDLATMISGSYDIRYVIAMSTNSVEANKAMNAMAKEMPELLTQEDVKTLVQAWIKVQKTSIQKVFDLVYNQSNDYDDNGLKVNFDQKCKAINSMIFGTEGIGTIDGVSHMMLAPLFGKFKRVFARQIIPKYILSYLKKSEDSIKDMDAFKAKIINECDSLTELIRSLDFDSEGYTSVLDAWKDFMTGPIEEIYSTHSFFVEQYPDFTVDLAYRLYKARPDYSAVTNTMKDFLANYDPGGKIYDNSVQRARDNNIPEDNLFKTEIDSQNEEKRLKKPKLFGL